MYPLLRTMLLVIVVIASMVTNLKAQQKDSVRRAKFVADSIALSNTAKLRDTVPPKVDTAVTPTVLTPVAKPDSTARIVLKSKALHNPTKAAFYSAVLPGLGQMYNREYWKVPIVYAALGVSAGFFVWNMDQYKTYRDAYRVRSANQGNPNFVDPYKRYSDQDLTYLRDAYRQYVDYSVLVFVLAYGLNIVDATVFAHLKQFDISNDLSMQVYPKVINGQGIGVGINFQLGKKNSYKHSYAGGLRF
ncbi:hypothetical protein LX64_03219 [Chitinophaga skermanii]|uniref:DUF5683 domain-containing protein n=1 Tax=Chitinophaga skermanii TaxID=331697 RepID=A0A327QCM1_9BACT|nr:DUF5683 domain-containing protein [Chitinophaga skermanii]RAJ02210.1 hypothetical protein LX64_03219 [Chitinophaga skermanii]